MTLARAESVRRRKSAKEKERKKAERGAVAKRKAELARDVEARKRRERERGQQRDEVAAVRDATTPSGDEQEPKPDGPLEGRVVGALDVESLADLAVLATWADPESDTDLSNAIVWLAELQSLNEDATVSDLAAMIGNALANIREQLGIWDFGAAFVTFKKRKGEK